MLVAKTKDGEILEIQTVENIEIIKNNIKNTGFNIDEIDISTITFEEWQQEMTV